MTVDTRVSAQERLAELVVELSGAQTARAREAIDAAFARHGDSGDQLLNVADAIITLRHSGATPAGRPAAPLMART